MNDVEPISPREFCELVRRVTRTPPRLSRNLEPDLVGIELKQQVLAAVIEADPDAATFPERLTECARALGIAEGAARGVCSDILMEWRMAQSSPAFIPWLRAEAVREPRRKRERREGEFLRPGPAPTTGQPDSTSTS